GPQQLGTDRKVRRFGGLDVDAQPDFVLFGQKTDHAAPPGKAFRVADGQNLPPFEPGENPFQTFCFRLADEKNVAALDFFYTVKPLNFQLSILYDFIVDNLVQGLAEG